jgi:hypothetical protein
MVNIFLSGTVTNTGTSGSIDPASSVVIIGRPNRMSVLISNDGASTVYLALQDTAVANKGIRLASGGTFEINSDNWYSGTISAITSSGTSSLCVMEMLTD